MKERKEDLDLVHDGVPHQVEPKHPAESGKQRQDTDYDLKPALQPSTHGAEASGHPSTPSQQDSENPPTRRQTMNRDIAQGHWKQLKGKVREQWGRLTEDDVEVLAGNYERLVGKVQEKYGQAREEAANQVNAFLDRFKDSEEPARTQAFKPGARR